MPDKWDLDNIISEADQADVKKITLATRASVKRFLCRIGIHRKSSWQSVTQMAFQAQNEGTGETTRHDFELSMRCCFKCGRPGVRLRRI